MDLFIVLFWVVMVTSFSLAGSYYARRYGRGDAIVGLYVAFVLLSNIVAYKIVEFDLLFTTVYATAATMIFSVTFLMTDIMNERFGRHETQKMIFIAFLAQVAVAFFIYLSIKLPPAPFWQDQALFEKLLGFTPRVMLASWVAFLVSENMDAFIFSWFKKKTKGKYLWMRNAFSTIPSMVVDSVIFVTIAFYGLQSLIPLIVGVSIVKWFVAIINIPFFYLNRWVLYYKK